MMNTTNNNQMSVCLYNIRENLVESYEGSSIRKSNFILTTEQFCITDNIFIIIILVKKCRVLLVGHYFGAFTGLFLHHELKDSKKQKSRVLTLTLTISE